MAADVLDLKGLLETLLERSQPQFCAATHKGFRPGHCARVIVDGDDVGYFGEADPSMCATFDLTGAVSIFELNFAALAPRLATGGHFQRLSKFPPMHRDLALVVPEEVAAAQVIGEMQSVDRKLIETVKLFDVYQGDQMDTGCKSLAFTLVLQSSERTLEDREADDIISRVLAHVESSCGARLRVS